MLLSGFRSRPEYPHNQKVERSSGLSEWSASPWVAGSQAGQTGLQAGRLGWVAGPQAGRTGLLAGWLGRAAGSQAGWNRAPGRLVLAGGRFPGRFSRAPCRPLCSQATARQAGSQAGQTGLQTGQAVLPNGHFSTSGIKAPSPTLEQPARPHLKNTIVASSRNS